MQERAKIIEHYPTVWRRMVAAWQRNAYKDGFWLMYSGNYLFRTAGIGWALDPLALPHRLGQKHDLPIAEDLADLSFVLLTHDHADHLDIALINALASKPIRWIVPHHLLNRVINDTHLVHEQITVAHALQPLHFDNICVTPFDGLHKNLPAMGYLIEYANRKLLFPGDTREYDSSRLPDFGIVDVLFAHVWFGKACALRENPPLFRAFCEFCLALHPRRIALTHLYEVARAPEDYWTSQHARQAAQDLQQMTPEIEVCLPAFGQYTEL